MSGAPSFRASGPRTGLITVDDMLFAALRLYERRILLRTLLRYRDRRGPLGAAPSVLRYRSGDVAGSRKGWPER